MSNRNKAGKFLSGYILGSLIGAILALIFAPQSGEEIRDQIRSKYIELQARTSDRDYDLKESAAEGPEPFGPGGGRPGEAV